MKLLIKSLLVLSLMFSVSACFEDAPTRVIINHLFDVEMGLMPFQKEYQAGSVIHVTVNIPNKSLVDLNNNETVLIPNTTFENNLRVVEVGDISNMADWVELDLVEGDSSFYELTAFGATAISRFGCPNDTYVFDLALTFPRAGNFAILLNGANLSSIFFTDDDDCSVTANFTANNLPLMFHTADVRYLFGLEDVNLDVYEAEVAGMVWDSDVDDLLAEKLAFFVKVVD